jgi:hypothetical protein
MLALAWRWEPARPGVDIDEVYWVGSSYYYHLAVHERDWHHPHWTLYAALENPPLAKYAIGATLAATGQRVATIDPLSYAIDYWIRRDPRLAGITETDRQGRARVVQAGDAAALRELHRTQRVPVTPRMVMTVRTAMAGLTVLASLGLLAFGLGAGAPLGGLLAAIALLVHPVVVESCGQVAADAPALAATTLAALAGLVWYRHFSTGPATGARELGWSVVSGVAVALACAAKMNSLVMLALMGLATLAVTASSLRRRDFRGAGWSAVNGLVIAATAVLLFVLINPAIVMHPREGIRAVFGLWSAAEEVQAVVLGGYLADVPERANAVMALLYGGWWGFGGFVAIGAGWFVRRPRDPAARFALGWWLVALASVMAWLPFARVRYLMPVLTPSLVIAAWALADLAERAAGWATARRGKRRLPAVGAVVTSPRGS